MRERGMRAVGGCFRGFVVGCNGMGRVHLPGFGDCAILGVEGGVSGFWGVVVRGLVVASGSVHCYEGLGGRC